MSDDIKGSIRSPTDSLPLELLIEIFSLCPQNDPLSPLVLRQVSKWWRAVANSSPRIWQRIRLDEYRLSLNCLQAQAELWIQRSVPLKIDVELNLETQDFMLPILSPLLPCIDRWRTFVVTGYREEVDLFTSQIPLHHEALDTLRITIQDDDPAVLKTTFVPEWPDNYTMNIWLSELPRSGILAPMRFISVIIVEDVINDFHTSSEAILDFLSACPELETFEFSSWHYHEEPPSNPFPVVSLPNLRNLHLRSTCIARAILSSLYVPHLTDLCLAHLNVEFSFESEYHEEGDSDDDAQDFSQSPSSDHATGMGLRKLLSRSRPPLVTLDMDFSDMRTKDFKYVFDRLPHLQEFMIVASDMSNKVISLLRPFTLPGQDDTIHVRLPRLRSLSLYNCQQLSGDAIVDALVARAEHAGGGADTLGEVSIFGCQGFTPEHQHKLRKTLGSRLHVG